MTDVQGSAGSTAVQGRIGLWAVLAAVLLAGCHQPAVVVDRAQIESMANPEAYLMSLLKVRYANPDVHCELGRYYHRVHQDAKAEHHFETALDFDPAHRPTQAALVKMLIDQGKTAEAQQQLRRFQQPISGSPRPLVELGLALDAEGLSDYALSCFEQALRLAPDIAPTNKYIGLHYFKHKQTELAKQYLQRSFEINPKQPEVARALGELGITVEVPGDVETSQPSR